MLNNTKPDCCVDICPPVRNRYFYGKLLDVFHFELEQNYFNAKRWMLNRLVGGYGVICGLNVQLGSDNQSIIVTPGLAIDKCGHEIMVCEPSSPWPLPTPPKASTNPPANTPGGSQAAGATGAPASSATDNPAGNTPRANGPSPAWMAGIAASSCTSRFVTRNARVIPYPQWAETAMFNRCAHQARFAKSTGSKSVMANCPPPGPLHASRTLLLAER